MTRKWEKKVVGGRNEAWDCLVYALAARMSLPVKLSKSPMKAQRPKRDGVLAEMPSADNDNAVPEKQGRPKRRERQRWGAYR